MDTHLPDQSHKPENLPHHLAIVISGEAALEHLRQVAQRIEEQVSRLLPEEREKETPEGR